MTYKVRLTRSVLNDLYAISDYYLKQVSDNIALDILTNIQSAMQSLDRLPERGSIPVELIDMGINRYRQIITSVYRIIYRVEGNNVYIIMVIDGRRDVATALLRRLQT